MLRHWFARGCLRLFGWTVEAPPAPAPPRYVVIAAPHTSNWDLPFTLWVGWALRLRIHWLGKHTLFEKPLVGPFFRALGGIPVDRRSPQDLVRTLVEEFARRDELVLAVPPEGTRSKRALWKSGFYHIAAGANVPIGLGYLDFARKRGGVGGFVVPSGDLRADMDRIRAFYADKRGRHPELETIPRLKDEDEAPPAAAAG